MNDRAPRCTAANDPWLREAVGAYLLGALEPAESDRVAAHLAGCASCRAEYGELAELLPLLASVTEADAVNGPVMPEPAVLGRVLASTSQQLGDVNSDVRTRAPEYDPQPRRRVWQWRPRRMSIRTRIALAGAAALVVAGGVVAGTMMSSSSTGLPPGSWTASAAAPLYPGQDDQIKATIDVSPAAKGSKIQLRMDNVPAGYSCAMVVISATGGQETTGEWKADTEGSFAIPGWSSFTPERISSIKVELPNGSTLLTLNHPHT